MRAPKCHLRPSAKAIGPRFPDGPSPNRAALLHDGVAMTFSSGKLTLPKTKKGAK